MNCPSCKTGQLSPGKATVTLERAGAIVVLKNVPANICDNCGEYYLSADVTKSVLEKAEASVANGADVDVRQYVAC